MIMRDASDTPPDTPDTPDTTISRISGIVLSVLISGYALYLSWMYNTSKNVPLIGKIIYGAFACIFGLLYLIMYALRSALT